MDDAPDGITRSYVVDAVYQARLARRVFRYTVLSMSSVIGILVALQLLGLALLLFGQWQLVFVPIPLAIVLGVALRFSIVRQVHRNLPVGTVLTTRFAEDALVLADGLVTSTIDYSLIREVEMDGEWVIVRSTRSGRAGFWPSQVFPKEELDRVRPLFGVPGSGDRSVAAPEPTD